MPPGSSCGSGYVSTLNSFTNPASFTKHCSPELWSWRTPWEWKMENRQFSVLNSQFTIDRAIDRALLGFELTREEGIALARARGPELEALVTAADDLRRRSSGEMVTYVVNRNINFTNICFVGCKFCAFGKG